MRPTRREFLRRGLGGTTLLASGLTLPGFLRQTALAAAPRRDARILVVVQLSGGNDGLNTVIPYADDAYHRARPTLRIAAERVHKLNDALGLHPDMAAFKRLYDDGWLSVAMNVGYPNPDRSHFRSMDIWHTASERPEAARDGWLGRAVERLEPTDAAPPALHLDDVALPLALHAQRMPVPSIRGLDALHIDDGDEIARVIRAAGTARDGADAGAAALDDLLFVQRTALSSCANAKRIDELAVRDGLSTSYPDYGLASRLEQIARLIGAEFGARVYYTSLGGFDTHARQTLAHGPLLRELAESVAAFFADLKARGLAERVALMTFSEFGRRVGENGSLGTDHGAAAPLFVAGPGCRAGICGGPPNLGRLADGDIAHETDFRQVYGALLDDWLDLSSSEILGADYKPVRILRDA